MKSATKTNLLIWVAAVLLVISQLVTSCAGQTPTFDESGPPESRIVVITDAKNNCASPVGTSSSFSTVNTRTQETTWSIEGKIGVGGKIPLGFPIPSLDIEAAITDHYGRKETRTWQNSYTDDFPVPGNSKSILAVFFQEITRKGVIHFYDKQIEYEYPAEITRLGWNKVDVGCNLPPPVDIMCADLSGGTSSPGLPPAFESMAGAWRLLSPSHGEIVQLDIEIQSVSVIIHVQTDGSSGVADWGVQYQCIWSDPMQVTFDQLMFKTTTLTLNRSAGGKLYVTVVDRYINPPVVIPAQTREYIFTQ